MPAYHAVVWIDHHEAHILQFTPEGPEQALIHAHGGHRQTHHRSGVVGSGKAPLDAEYFNQVAGSLSGVEEILVVGPARTKHEFAAHLERHAPGLAKKVLSVEDADHPSDGELLKLARRYFVAADRMRTQPGTRPT